MTMRSWEAGASPSGKVVDVKTLLSVAKVSVHFTPSSDKPTAKDFGGNSQSMVTDCSWCTPPRSTVMVTGAAGSNALAYHKHTQFHVCQHAIEARKKKTTQKVLELPSTALLAPCASGSAVLLELIAEEAATSLLLAAEPFWLKQYCTAPPNRN